MLLIANAIASLLGLGYFIWLFTNIVWMDSHKEFKDLITRTPYRSFLLTNYCLLAFFLFCYYFLKSYTDYAEYFAKFCMAAVFIFGIYTTYIQKRDSNIAKNILNEVPGKFVSMASLYNIPLIKRIFGKKRKTDFKCIYCAQPISVSGRFKCRAGHVPTENRYIFENCHQCDDIHEYIKCNSCGQDIGIYDDKYNQEEIDSRGKEYISRKSPYKGLIKNYLVWSIVFYINTVLGLKIIANRDTDWDVSVLPFTLIGFAVCLLHYYYYVPRKDVVMENPYKGYHIESGFFDDIKRKEYKE
ncbi:MAG: hypothetical protein WC799_18110 [Desulfobacteraceae bacterium]|jgi:hypothetical protein